MLARIHDDDRIEAIHLGDAIFVEPAAPAPANDARYRVAPRAQREPERASTLYEEFHPFGTTSYAANDSGIEVSAKRYRYIGKERDEETGLYHLGARYYASWLGRWTAADPIGLQDGVNRYAYATNSPISLRDVGGRRTESPPLSPDEHARLSEVSLESFGIKPGEKPKPKVEREAKMPGRTGKRPYSPDKRGEANLERAQARHQAQLGAEYDANKKVADEVRSRDGGAAGVVAETVLGATGVGLVVDAIGFKRALDDFGAGKVGILAVGIAALAFIPLVGDAAKQAGRHADELRGLARGAGDARGTGISNDLPGGGAGGADDVADAGAAAAGEGGLRLSGATRLHPDEIATGERLSAQLGRPLRESEHIGAEFVDDSGRSYDALGRPAASKFWNETEFFSSIDSHLLKDNDFTAVDLTGFTEAQKASVSAHLDALPATSQARIVRIGF